MTEAHRAPGRPLPNLPPLGPISPLLQEPVVWPRPLFLLLPLLPIYLLRNISLMNLRRREASSSMTRMNKALHILGGHPDPNFGKPTASSQGRTSGPPPKPHTFTATQAMGVTSMRYLCSEPSCQHQKLLLC